MEALRERVQLHQVNEGSKSVRLNGIRSSLTDYAIFDLPASLSSRKIAPDAFYYSTHRQRTQNYIKTLESEVVRLRGSESGLMRQRDELQAQVEILKTTILLSNIPLPPGIDGSLTESSPTFNLNESEMASISYRMDDASHQRLHVDWMSPPTPNMSHMGQPVMNAHQVSISSSAGQDQDVGQTLTSLPNGKSFCMLLSIIAE